MLMTTLNLQQLASNLNYESWERIKQEVNSLTSFPKDRAGTIPCATKLYAHGQLIAAIGVISEVLKGPRTFYLIGKTEYSATSLSAEFGCVACGNLFKVEYNPARYHMDCFICKKCKKSVVHKCHDYRAKYEASMLKSHGVKYPFQSEKSFEKFKISMQRNHGVNFSGESPMLLAKTRSKLAFGGSSKLEVAVGSLLQTLYGVRVKLGQKIQVGPKQWIYPDILIDSNVIVEVYGDYWHGNPAIYQSHDIVAHCHTAKDIWSWDGKRVKMAEQHGYTVFVIWELAWKKTQKKVLEKLDETVRTSLM